MFKIVDLQTGQVRQYETQRATAVAWKVLNHRHEKVTFDDLNMTGNDTIVRWERTGVYICVPGFPDIPEYKRVRYLRRYMVLDGDDRCIDVRKWDIDWNSSYASRVTEFYVKYPEYEVKEHKWYKPKPGKFRQEPCGEGAKRLHHGNVIHVHRSLIEDSKTTDYGEYEGLVRAGIKQRKLAPDDIWEVKERRYFARYCKHACWKNSKAGAQWAKHKSDAKSQRRKCGKKIED